MLMEGFMTDNGWKTKSQEGELYIMQGIIILINLADKKLMKENGLMINFKVGEPYTIRIQFNLDSHMTIDLL
jgi:hypothetical protein